MEREEIEELDRLDHQARMEDFDNYINELSFHSQYYPSKIQIGNTIASNNQSRIFENEQEIDLDSLNKHGSHDLDSLPSSSNIHEEIEALANYKMYFILICLRIEWRFDYLYLFL